MAMNNCKAIVYYSRKLTLHDLVEICIAIVAHICYTNKKCTEDKFMGKSISISIRVSEEDLVKLKQAARLEAYASYSEFIRRTALIEANSILKRDQMRVNTEKPE